MRLFLTACSIAIMGLFTACNDNSNNTYTISGEAKDIDDQVPVYVLKIVNEQPQPVDTLMIQNEAFTGTFENAKTGDIYLIRTDVVPVNLLFFPEDQDLHVVINKDNPGTSSVSGNPATESYFKYISDINDINTQMAELNTKASVILQKHERDSEEFRELEKEMMDYMELHADITKTYIKNNSNSIFSVILVRNLLQQQQINTEEAEKMLSHLTPAIANHEQTKAVRQFIEENKTNLNVGSVVPDFSAKTPEGDELALSDVMKKGKYTLIDFWAAWCAPCRRENPNLVRLYEEYHDKGLEILGVSLDRNRNEWLGAIEKDKLTWHQISNLQFWDDPIAKQYKIRAIPASFVIDSNGEIVGKDLRGQQLHDFIGELLNE
ncbi:MAG TPA: TlpA disulfide reductase family protein [Flavobacteriaceae bacterium]|nr:TlpA disulfide reductase family protein [Flavobacteriaceae bacterium]